MEGEGAMRVAQVLCAGGVGGAETVGCELAAALAQSGVDVRLYAILELRAGEAGCAALRDRVERVGVPTRIFRTNRRASPALARELRQATLADDLDVWHAHAYKAAALGRFSGARRRVFTLHGFDQTRAGARLKVAAAVDLGRRAAHTTIAVSASVAAHAPGAVVIPNGVRAAPPVDREAARRALAGYGLDPTKPWIAALGRLTPIKRFDVLLAALTAVPDAQLLLCGDGPERQALTVRAALMGAADRVAFTGHLEDVHPVYGAADVLALSSDAEACPMVVLEAFAHGLPVVATRVGGVPDLVRDGVDGLLVEAGDVAGFGRALAELLADPTAAAAHARRRAEDFSLARWAERHLAVYQP